MGSYKGDSSEETIEGRQAIGSMSSQSRPGLEEGLYLNEEIPIDDPNYVARHKEMFWESTAQNRGIYFKENLIDFGFSQVNSRSDSKEIILVNDLNYDVKVYWGIPNVTGKLYYPFLTL